MREELKTVIREVRRNEAIIEYMELRGRLPETRGSLGQVSKSVIESLSVDRGRHEQHGA